MSKNVSSADNQQGSHPLKLCKTKLMLIDPSETTRRTPRPCALHKEIPSTKHQIPNNIKAPNSKFKTV